jgi:hypothetical protein
LSIKDGNFFADYCPHCRRLIEQRTNHQNAAFLAVVQQIAAARDWPAGSGVLLDVPAWKQLLMRSWERVHERETLVVPAIDGVGITAQGFDIVYRRPSRLAKQEMSELTECTLALSAQELELDLPEPKAARSHA